VIEKEGHRRDDVGLRGMDVMGRGVGCRAKRSNGQGKRDGWGDRRGIIRAERSEEGGKEGRKETRKEQKGE
jgi:hypothetical protein